MRSPIIWFGGKGRMSAKLLKLLPNHKTYVEAFGGGASLLFAKPPSPVEVYNDINQALYDFFTVLSKEESFQKFYRRVAALPYSRKLYYDYRDTWQDETDIIEKTAKWFVVAQQSFGGLFGRGWGFDVTTSNRNMSSSVSDWLSCLESLPQVHARLQRVQIECRDWRKILDTYDTQDTLFYLDPPYVRETRSDGGYEHELTDDDHRELVQRILELEGNVMLSGYDHEIYAPLANWEKHVFQTACHAAGRTRYTKILGDGSAIKMQPRTEVVWVKNTNKAQTQLEFVT